MELHQRSVSEEQMQKFAGYMAEIFEAFGLNLNTPGTEETPQRFVEALFDATEGYDGDPKLLKVFDQALRGTGADGGADCEYAGYDAPTTWRGGISRGSPPVRGDARGTRDEPFDAHDVLARRIRQECVTAQRVFAGVWSG